MNIFTRNRKLLPVLFLCGVALLVGGSFLFFRNHSSDTSRIGKVTKENLIQRVTIAGIIVPRRKTIVTAPYKAYVQKLFVKIGDQVKRGDPLVTLTQSLQSNDGLFPLRAQFPGTVVQIEKTEGEYVKEGDTKDFIMRIDDVTALSVISQAPEIDRAKLQIGQEAIIQPVAIQSESFKGTIKDLSLAAKERDQYSRSQQVEFTVKVEIIEPNKILYPGMSVIMDIVTAKKENVLALKHEYLRKEGTKSFVTLKNGSTQEVELGFQNEDAFEIVSGLKEGEEVRMIDFAEISQVPR